MTEFRMFEKATLGVIDTCKQCRWLQTEMCPRHVDFVGRHLREPSDYPTICHRFTITQEERERRWQQVMDKLHENLGDDIPLEGEYPF